jgi:hypothetical protein
LIPAVQKVFTWPAMWCTKSLYHAFGILNIA